MPSLGVDTVTKPGGTPGATVVKRDDSLMNTGGCDGCGVGVIS